MAALVFCLLALISAVSAAPESRVIGGTPTTIEEFPYAASFLYTYPGAGITVQRCVGSLISSWHILTSGFCYTGAVLTNMKIRVGSTSSIVGGTLVDISHFVKHPGYAEAPRAGDIAVTFLAWPIGITSTTNTLFLPPAFMDIPDGTSLKVVSWGFESMTGPQLELLKTVFFNKMNVAVCQVLYGASADSVTISDDKICAQAPGRGICLGDSGAPMVIDNVAIGLSSYFHNCDDSYPAVFTRIDRYTNWIMSVTSSGRSGEGVMATPQIRRE